ncbi:hypothetical protein TUM12147_22890 [Citrobacter europaeus]|jgi:hypothetical protein|nr:hypothetical protein TUM12147_22890 [Citrobacter europaeus]GIZ22802.1 hypothetical protein TUM12148_14660 [Citrobacter europaeus]
MSYINKAQLINIIYNVTTPDGVLSENGQCLTGLTFFAIPDVITAVALIMRGVCRKQMMQRKFARYQKLISIY